MNAIPVQSKPLLIRPVPNFFLRRASLPALAMTESTPKRKNKPVSLPPLNYHPSQATNPAARTQKAPAPIPDLKSMAHRVSQAMESAVPTLQIPVMPAFKTLKSGPVFTQKKLALIPPDSAIPNPSEDEIEKSDGERHQDDTAFKTHIQTSGIEQELEKPLQTLIEESVQRALYHPDSGLNLYLEPMLRHSVRRALAEQSETSHHFSRISASDKLAWRLKALFTSRSFDDIVFERTRRYQVMEVFLLRRGSKHLVSYASSDPARHSNSKSIQSDLKKLLENCHDHEGQLTSGFELPESRHALVRKGQLTFIIAIMRGDQNPLILLDLDYAILQIEQRFEDQLKDNPSDLFHPLQSILETCLLIQSPPPPK